MDQPVPRPPALRPALLLALLLLAAAANARRLASTACPFVPPFGNPINVLNVAFARLAAGLRPTSEDDIRVMYVNMQSFDFPVFRYVFKYLQKNGNKPRLLYIGVLSTLPSFDDLNNPDATHSVIRLIMTGDLLDIQRVLGDFTMTKWDELNCGNVRSDFAEYTAQRPVGFDNGKSSGADIEELSSWLTKVGTDQNGGQMPTTVDFQGVLSLLKAYQNGRSNSTSLPTIKAQTASNTGASPFLNTGSGGTLPSVMYSLPFSQILRGDGSSIIRGFTVDPRTIRSLKSAPSRHPHSSVPPKKTKVAGHKRLRIRKETRSDRRGHRCCPKLTAVRGRK